MSTGHGRRHLDDVHRQVIALVGDDHHRVQGHGIGPEHVQVKLRSDEDALARDLHERFGDSLEIRLGRHPYPLGPAGPPPPPVPESTVPIPGLRLTAELERQIWRPGEIIRGLLRLTNTSAEQMPELAYGSPATGLLLDPAGVVVAGFSGPTRGTGRRVQLAPGAEETVLFVSGSDTFDPAGGAVLPPGDYLVVVRLHVRRDQDQELLVAPAAPLRLAQA